MAYIALYRKWRPALFEDVVGQQHITETLQKAIATDKVAHAYLFSSIYSQKAVLHSSKSFQKFRGKPHLDLPLSFNLFIF